MENPTLSGKELEKVLSSGELDRKSNFTVIGMVKSSKEKGNISFTQSGCDTWVDLPIDMIDEAEKLGTRPCKDHSHVIMQITLKEPRNKEGKILISLLSQTVSSNYRSSSDSMISGSNIKVACAPYPVLECSYTPYGPICRIEQVKLCLPYPEANFNQSNIWY